MKRFGKTFNVLLIGTVAASLALTGCGKQESKASPSPNGGTPAASEKPAEKVKLSIMFQKNQGTDLYYDWMQENIKLYKEKHPNVDFDITANASGDNYLTVVTTQMAANNVPDILQGWTLGRMKPFAEQGRLLDLSEAINSDANWKNFLQPDPLKATTFNGGIYGIPSTLDTEVIFYNKDVFAKAGLKEPQSYDEFLHIIDVLKAANITPMTIPNKEVWTGTLPFMMLAERIGGLDMYQSVVVDKTAPWTSAPLIDAGKQLQDLMKRGAFEKDVNSVPNSESVAKLVEGKAGMMAGGTWALSDLYSKMNDKLGYFNFPDIPGGKGSKDHYIVIPNIALSISKETKHKPEAIDFMKFIFSQDRQKAFAKLGFLGTTKVKLEANDMNPLAKSIQEDLVKSKGFMYPWDVPLGAAMGQELNNSTQTLYINQDPAQVFDKLQKKQDSQKK